MIDERSTDDYVRLAALRAMLDDGICELDAGLGIEMTPEASVADALAAIEEVS
jgi:hypothetical protein